MRLILNMIVKNEAARIERALSSALPYIEGAFIVDTGSTDDTQLRITEFFEAHHKPCKIITTGFEDWSQARNTALIPGREWAKQHNCDYLLLMDADMELVVKDPVSFLEHRDGPSYDMYQHAGATHYQNRRLVNVNTAGGYRGVTHEYLDIDSAGFFAESIAYFVDHADGANRPDKFKRDIRLLRAGLKVEPDNVRYFYYLAQSYRDAKDPHHAIKWYRKRIEAGGWEEEVWSAQYNLAQCYHDLKNDAEFIRNLLIAYNMRPTRAEPLYDLAKYYRENSMNAAAALIAEQAMTIPSPKDVLFVNDYVYQCGCADEFGITAYYVPGKREKGFETVDRLSLKRGPYGQSRELARFNLYWYLPTIKELCPSFQTREIDFTPPDGWTAMNPSIALVDKEAWCVVRTVNYKINEHGQYLIRGTDGTANGENPINTRNWLVAMGFDPMSQTRPVVMEIENPKIFPVEFPLVVGFEDMRLFQHRDHLWASATVRQLHVDGNCEQVLARIDGYRDGNPRIAHYERMLRLPRTTEKNWSPIELAEPSPMRFMWKPGEIVDRGGTTVSKHDTGMATDHIRGSSQLIRFGAGWLAIVHEARNVPGSPLRYYYHRFIQYDADGAVSKISRPFVFESKQIEFCAGMCMHPTKDFLVLSYGVRDSHAMVAEISHLDVTKLLWFQ